MPLPSRSAAGCSLPPLLRQHDTIESMIWAAGSQKLSFELVSFHEIKIVRHSGPMTRDLETSLEKWQGRYLQRACLFAALERNPNINSFPISDEGITSFVIKRADGTLYGIATDSWRQIADQLHSRFHFPQQATVPPQFQGRLERKHFMHQDARDDPWSQPG